MPLAGSTIIFWWQDSWDSGGCPTTKDSSNAHRVNGICMVLISNILKRTTTYTFQAQSIFILTYYMFSRKTLSLWHSWAYYYYGLVDLGTIGSNLPLKRVLSVNWEKHNGATLFGRTLSWTGLIEFYIKNYLLGMGHFLLQDTLTVLISCTRWCRLSVLEHTLSNHTWIEHHANPPPVWAMLDMAWTSNWSYKAATPFHSNWFLRKVRLCNRDQRHCDRLICPICKEFLLC